MFFAAFLTVASAAAPADTATGARKLNPAEQWVIKQVIAGEIADLEAALNADQTKKFPEKKDRKLSGRFLEDLLTGRLPGVKSHRNGVRIQRAIIENPIDLTNAQIPYEVWLDYCEFKDRVILRRANFANRVTFDKSTFAADANFERIEIRLDASFHGAVFEGLANFRGAKIDGDFTAREAQFRNKAKGAAFDTMKTGRVAAFQKAVFEGPANFTAATVTGDFIADEAHFNNKEEVTDFNGMKVRHIAAFAKAVFEGPVSFIGMDIDSDFQAEEAHFNNKKQGANFNSMKVGNIATFPKAVFEGPVDFRMANIVGNLVADEAQFHDKEHAVDFNSMKVGRIAFFTKTIFDGPVICRYADIAINLEAFEAQFKDTEQGADFNRMKVGNVAFFKKAVFEGPVDFGAADITSTFQGEETQFRSKTKAVQLTMKCGMRGFFVRTTFAGPVSFADASFLDLMILHANTDGSAISKVDLSRSSIKRQLSIEDTRILDLVAGSLHVEGPADLTNVIVEHSADFRDGDFATLDLSRSIWPKNGKDGGAFNMQRMNYKYLRADSSESESHKALLKLASRSAFTAEVYGTLEAFFLRQGYRGDADRAFIAGKRRERKEVLHGMRAFGSLLLDRLVGYGRRPWRAGGPCAFFVVLGCFLFSSRKMELQKSDGTPRVYNPFWYSLGLFLPVVNLEADKVWKPKSDQAFLRNYMRVHILLGWILIPILLAALTGLIK